MKEILTEIEIAASPERVWNVLVDLERFPEWNPFIKKAEGEIKSGAHLKVRIVPPGGRSMTFKPTVKCAVINQELRWLGQLFVPGLFDGEHSFEILPAGSGKIRFVQREIFRGILVPFFWKSMEGPTNKGFIAMNAALKIRAENFED